MVELFGGVPEAVKFVVVFMVVLGSVIFLLWYKFNTGRLAGLGQGGRQRLTVVEAAAVDVRRRLVLVKRDNIEHLLMIGGPTDIVVEANIVRASTREPRPIPDINPDVSRPPAAAGEKPDWSLPLEPMGRPARTVDLDAAMPEPPARTAREAMVDSMRALRSEARRVAGADPPSEEVPAPALAPAPAPDRRVAEGERQPTPEVPPLEARREDTRREDNTRRGQALPGLPRPVRPLQPAPPVAASSAAPILAQRPAPHAPAAAAASADDDSSFAEMAQRLEAALRRPTKPVDEGPAVRMPGPPVRKAAPPDAAPAAKPAGGAKPPGVKPPGVKLAGKPAAALAGDFKASPGKVKNEPVMDSLEDEMARMLGRSPGKS